MHATRTAATVSAARARAAKIARFIIENTFLKLAAKLQPSTPHAVHQAAVLEILAGLIQIVGQWARRQHSAGGRADKFQVDVAGRIVVGLENFGHVVDTVFDCVAVAVAVATRNFLAVVCCGNLNHGKHLFSCMPLLACLVLYGNSLHCQELFY